MEMGTGKTLTSIAIVGQLWNEKRIHRLLIVAPLSILGVWRDEFAKFAAYDYSLAVLEGTGAKKATYGGYIAKVHDRVDLQIRNYAYDCAVEMAVNADAARHKLDAELAAYKNDCQHSNGKHPDGSRRANSRLNEETFKKAVQANEPGDVNEASYIIAAEMFKAIQNAEAAECAKQCLALAEQARQKKIYQEACERYRQNSKDAITLEEVSKKFKRIQDYKDAHKQAQRCLEEAEAIRSSLYDAALQVIEEAGNDSAKWHAAKEKLAHSALKHYRNVEELRNQAEKRHEECLAAEKEKARREAEDAAKRKKRVTVLALSFTAVTIAIILLVTKVIIPKSHYDKALQFRANGQWEEAVAAFAEAGEYSDATKQITETHYQHAQSLMKSGDYKQAYVLLTTLKGYADVDALLAHDENLLAAAREAMFAVGNYVTFGTYPQTKAGNDKTPIEWLVLARDGDNALLLSRYGLDAQPYNTEYTNITWEKCTLRTWLNKDFLNRAFTEAEQSAILLTNVDNSISQCYSGYSTSGGNNTQDKVFLLSYAEANKYLDVTYDDGNNTKSRIAPTAYAIAQGAYTSDKYKTADGQAAWWWLRSPGHTRNYAASVFTDGSLSSYSVDNERGSVRPALWVNLESGIF